MTRSEERSAAVRTADAERAGRRSAGPDPDSGRPQYGIQRFALIRHGQTDWNQARRVQGSTDVPLNDTGRADAIRSGRDLARAPVRWEECWASDLSRASETASLICGQLSAGVGARQAGLVPGLVPALRERSFGEAEGLTSEEISARWPEVRAHAEQVGWTERSSLNDVLVPAAIPGIEDSAACGARGARFLEHLARQRAAGVPTIGGPHATGDPCPTTCCPANAGAVTNTDRDAPVAVALICHGTLIRLTVATLTGTMLPRLGNGTVIWLRHHGPGAWTLAGPEDHVSRRTG